MGAQVCVDSLHHFEASRRADEAARRIEGRSAMIVVANETIDWGRALWEAFWNVEN